MSRIPLIALACLALAACRDKPADPLELIGKQTEWTVTEIAGAPVPEGVKVTITQPEPGMLAGTSGCNRYSGPVRSEAGKLHVGAIAGTRMMCPEPQMTAETAFHSTISRTTGAKLDGEVLTLTDDAGTALIRARK